MGGATVITNLFSAIPFLGSDIVYWLWGGFAVDNATLTRFFTLHFLLPFIISGLSIIHLLFLHSTGSRNPLGVNRNFDKTPFHPYFSVKDLVGIIIFFIGYIYAFLRSIPNKLGGVVALALAVMVLYIIPFYGTNKFKRLSFYPLGKIMFWSLISIVVLLT